MPRKRSKTTNPAAALARQRWAKTSPEERKAAAQKAARARWAKTKKKT